MVYKFRAILDAEDDVFRDIAISDENTLEDLHNVLVNAFGFDGSEMASFYTCDDKWNQEDEIPLFDTGDVPGEQLTMADHTLNMILDEDSTKIIYVYDFMNMWTFLIELAAIEEEQSGATYPEVLFVHGQMPNEAPDKEFESENEMDFEEDGYDEEDFDEFGDHEGYEDYGFEENWN